MLGMEKMIASLIGMEPDELQAKVKEIETVFTTLANALQELANSQKKNEAMLAALCDKNLNAEQKAKLADVLQALERADDERSNHDN